MSRGLCRSSALDEPWPWDIDPRARRPVGVPFARRLFMLWQTPTATDIRFGFEITLYVAAR